MKWFAYVAWFIVWFLIHLFAYNTLIKEKGTSPALFFAAFIDLLILAYGFALVSRKFPAAADTSPPAVGKSFSVSLLVLVALAIGGWTIVYLQSPTQQTSTLASAISKLCEGVLGDWIPACHKSKAQPTVADDAKLLPPGGRHNEILNRPTAPATSDALAKSGDPAVACISVPTLVDGTEGLFRCQTQTSISYFSRPAKKKGADR